jgi:protein TonB
MNKTALSLTAVVHATAALLLQGAAHTPIKPPGSTTVQLQLMKAPSAAPQAPPRQLPVVKLAAVPWTPWPVPVVPTVSAAVAPQVPAAVPALAVDLAPAAVQASASVSPPAAAALERAAALPPEHGLCSARGVQRHYPALLRERGVEGQVLLRVQVDEQGRAAEVRVQGGSGWRLLDEAARRIAADCPYVPARRGDQALVAWVEYPLRFALH